MKYIGQSYVIARGWGRVTIDQLTWTFESADLDNERGHVGKGFWVKWPNSNSLKTTGQTLILPVTSVLKLSTC